MEVVAEVRVTAISAMVKEDTETAIAKVLDLALTLDLVSLLLLVDQTMEAGTTKS